MNTLLPIDDALHDKNLLGAALGNAASWQTWITALRAAHGLPLTAQQASTFATIAGNRKPPTKRVRELWCVVGRGGGKSRTASAVAVHAALLQRHTLAPGEIGFVLVLSQTIGQARTVFSYAKAFIEASPILRREIESLTQNEIRLHGNIIVGTHPNSFRSVRGRTLLAVIFDESAFWRDESSALPDIEAFRAVTPSLIRSGGMLIGISTPYRRAGLLYTKHHDHFGVDDNDILVVQGDSRTFNPTLSETAIAQAMADDPAAGASEWLAEFRSDIAAFLSDADIDSCVDHDRPVELGPQPGCTYHAFCDPSGGRGDAMTLAIGHRVGERTIIDVLRGHHPPFDPSVVTADFATVLKEFGLREVTGDNYSAAWCETEFKSCGIRYIRSELPKGKLYIEGLPNFTRRTISLPDHPRLLRELRLLERRTHVGGRDSVDHGRTGSDDHANAVFGLLFVAKKSRPRLRVGTLKMTADGPDGREEDPATGCPLNIAPLQGVVFRLYDEDGNILKESRLQ